MQILLVEDDQPTSAVLTASLRAQQYQVSTATDGQTGLDLAQQFEYDLILLDVELPKLDGIGLCQRLRDRGNHTPVLLLTARDTTTDRILGLDAGADDYVIKPFDLAELLARVRALLRRGKAVSAALITWDNLSLDPVGREVRVGEAVLHLTPKEYGLLELFLFTPNRVFSRSAILDRLWNPAESPGEETVSTHIKCLRQKLEAAGVANPIKTVHGVGYRLRSPAESSLKPSSSPKAKQAKQAIRVKQAEHEALAEALVLSESLSMLQSPQAISPAAQLVQQKATEITARVWRQSGFKIVMQIREIERAVTALFEQRLTPELQQQAAQAAHKLAGSLGIFGLQEGSYWAKQLEDWLQPQILLDHLQATQLQDWVQALYRSLPALPEPPTALRSSAMSPIQGIQIQGITETADLPLVWVLLSDTKLTEQLASVALTWGLRLEARQTAQGAQSCPSAILLDLDAVLLEPGLDWLSQLKQFFGLNSQYPQPIIALSAQDSLQSRLAVTEMGGIFLQKPASVPDIFHAITHLLEWRPPAPSRVMVVDDDPNILTWLSNLLQPLEIQVTGLSNPEQFWQVLQSTAPDLLILDVEMPILKGWQLCQMVRSDLKWQHLPILFLSNDGSTDQVNQAFQSGADDYFHKPSGAAELVERILRRLKRASRRPGHLRCSNYTQLELASDILPSDILPSNALSRHASS